MDLVDLFENEAEKAEYSDMLSEFENDLEYWEDLGFTVIKLEDD